MGTACHFPTGERFLVLFDSGVNLTSHTVARYITIFVKSHNFVFEKIHMEGPLAKSRENKVSSINVLCGFFCHRSAPTL